MKNINELLTLSAPLAWQWAPTLCQRDTNKDHDCSSAHGVWQYLRLMGLANIESRRGFYQKALRAIGEPGAAPRILISGMADYAMLDFVQSAFDPCTIRPEVTLIDKCETPLALNRWYAGNMSCEINTFRSDILSFEGSAPFDAICTDYFLSWFPTSSRGALLRKWHDLLCPGGVVITATRLWPDNEGEEVRFSPQQIEKLRANVVRVAGTMRPAIGIYPEELAARVASYAAGYINYAVRTSDEVRALFEDCGFRVEHLSVENASERSAHSAAGSTASADTKHYVAVVARRS